MKEKFTCLIDPHNFEMLEKAKTSIVFLYKYRFFQIHKGRRPESFFRISLMSTEDMDIDPERKDCVLRYILEKFWSNLRFNQDLIVFRLQVYSDDEFSRFPILAKDQLKKIVFQKNLQARQLIKVTH